MLNDSSHLSDCLFVIRYLKTKCQWNFTCSFKFWDFSHQAACGTNEGLTESENFTQQDIATFSLDICAISHVKKSARFFLKPSCKRSFPRVEFFNLLYFPFSYYLQVGKVLDSPADYYHNRVPKKERKKTIVEELLADAEFQKKSKKKYREIVAQRNKTHYKAHKMAKKLKKNKKR